MFPLIENTQTDLIFPALDAASRRQVFQTLAEEVALHTTLPAGLVLEQLLLKEQKSGSGIGGGVAIPHLKMPGIDEPFTLLARLCNRIDFSAIDEQGVDLVFLLISPEDDGPLHLRRLARVSRTLRNEALCSQLRKAPDAMAMRAVFMTPARMMNAA
jgi:PTS system nitrogen regulatory IIA component